MLCLIRDKNVLFKDNEERIKCIDFEHLDCLNITPETFIQQNHYQKAIASLSEILEKNRTTNKEDTLILSSEFYQKPGFEEAITEHFGNKIQIRTDIELALQSLSSGDYLFVDIGKEFLSSYEISLNGNTYSIGKRTIQNNDTFILNLVNNFKMYMLPEVEKEELLKVLFDYSNIISLNKYLTDGKYAILGNENIYEDINLYFNGSLFQTIFNNDLVLSDFFSVLVSTINKQVNSLEKGRKLIIQTPLLDYSKVAEMINQHDNLYLVNMLQQHEMVRSFSINQEKFQSIIEIDLYPVKQKANLPFQSWMLAETNNLLLRFSNNGSIFSIDLSEIEEGISDTLFSIGSQKLLKYHVYINSDSIGNIYSKITDLNGVQYYKLLNN